MVHSLTDRQHGVRGNLRFALRRTRAQIKANLVGPRSHRMQRCSLMAHAKDDTNCYQLECSHIMQVSQSADPTRFMAQPVYATEDPD